MSYFFIKPSQIIWLYDFIIKLSSFIMKLYNIFIYGHFLLMGAFRTASDETASTQI